MYDKAFGHVVAQFACLQSSGVARAGTGWCGGHSSATAPPHHRSLHRATDMIFTVM